MVGPAHVCPELRGRANVYRAYMSDLKIREWNGLDALECDCRARSDGVQTLEAV